MRILDKVSDTINFLVENIVALLMGLMTVVVFVQVVFRLFAGSLPWSEELARYTMIYMVYLGVSVGVKNGSHIAIEFVVGLLPGKGKKIAELIADILMAVCFIIIIYFGIKVVNVTLMQKSPALRVKMGYVYFSLVLGGILMLIQCAVNFIKNAYSLATGADVEDGGKSFISSVVGSSDDGKGGMD